MALYTQKFIAADYLAGVQTQTHFFPRPLVKRDTGVVRRRGGRMSEESKELKGSRTKARARRRRNSRGGGKIKRRYSGARERKAPTMGAGRRVCYVSPLRSFPPTHSGGRGFSAFESRGSRGFPGKDVHRFLLSDRPFEQQPTW